MMYVIFSIKLEFLSVGIFILVLFIELSEPIEVKLVVTIDIFLWRLFNLREFEWLADDCNHFRMAILRWYFWWIIVQGWIGIWYKEYSRVFCICWAITWSSALCRRNWKSSSLQMWRLGVSYSRTVRSTWWIPFLIWCSIYFPCWY